MEGTFVCWLGDPDAKKATLVGAKAANLARCAAAGLPTIPGFVLTTAATALGVSDDRVAAELEVARASLAGDDDRPLVVRSSSTVEDTERSSMAGRFTSVLDVRGADSFRSAVRTVVSSAEKVLGSDGTVRPMAVLVQHQVDARLGGVLFGVDPVTGDRRHVVVEVVAGGPEQLVSGAVTAAHYVLTRRGRLLEQQRPGATPRLSRHLGHKLARMAARAAATLGTAQDIEWAVDDVGHLWMLQSRPVTAVAELEGSARVFGPGPVAETFPDPLRPLECDLWLEPLRRGIVRALRVTGAVSARELKASPVLTAVDGWAAVDLELIGVTTGERNFWRRINPVALGRRLATAWRVGRLRIALPRLAADLVITVDQDLAGIPAPAGLAPEALVDLLDRAGRELTTVHCFEVLAGMLLSDRPERTPATLVALEALDEGRRRELDDPTIIAEAPVVLALVPPSLIGPTTLPTAPPLSSMGPTGGLETLDERDALRLRARWLQELTATAVRALARHLVDRGTVSDPRLVAEMRIEEVVDVVRSRTPPADLASRAATPAGPPLPSRFRLTASGRVRRQDGSGTPAEGQPAGGGRVVGAAVHRVAPGAPRGGVILITQHLDPSLAAVLPSIDGMVAETGSPLSHLAILAREIGVPTVVGVDDARRRFPAGTRLLVDGTSGDVQALPEVDDALAGEASS